MRTQQYNATTTLDNDPLEVAWGRLTCEDAMERARMHDWQTNKWHTSSCVIWFSTLQVFVLVHVFRNATFFITWCTIVMVPIWKPIHLHRHATKLYFEQFCWFWFNFAPTRSVQVGGGSSDFVAATKWQTPPHGPSTNLNQNTMFGSFWQKP